MVSTAALLVVGFLSCGVEYPVVSQSAQLGALRPDVLEPMVRTTGILPAANPPMDDSNKWFVTVFTTDSCATCTKLNRDLDNSEVLKKLGAWAHVNVYSLAKDSQKFRFADYKVTAYPTIVVTPPPGGKYPYCYVLREVGYNGDAEGLLRRILEAVDRFLKRYSNDTPSPTPVLPEPLPPVIPPKPEPVPEPAPAPAPVPPAPTPEPTPPLADVELWLIVTDDSLLESVKLKAALELLKVVQNHYGEETKVRQLLLSDAQKLFPVTAADTPAILVTANGRVAAFMNAGVISTMYAGKLPSWLQFGGWGIVAVALVGVAVKSIIAARGKKAL